jgi:hypothetical protein
MAPPTALTSVHPSNPPALSLGSNGASWPFSYLTHTLPVSFSSGASYLVRRDGHEAQAFATKKRPAPTAVPRVQPHLTPMTTPVNPSGVRTISLSLKPNCAMSCSLVTSGGPFLP